MNKFAKKYWDEFWAGKEKPENVVAEQFGMENTPMADELAGLIVQGKKTATCSNHALYAHYNLPLPAVGGYTIILNSDDKPVCIIRTNSMEIIPMNKVTEEFAAAEGEGDLSYQYWYNGHKKYFTREMEEIGQSFAEDMLLVCEKFELVDVKNNG
ncbi:MAG: ASCH domain-containing protein [Defluviitaleaceae bacterium]|nr:ASCH domain-containing protein [Defluviitaleaceae bacterium]